MLNKFILHTQKVKIYYIMYNIRLINTTQHQKIHK